MSTFQIIKLALLSQQDLALGRKEDAKTKIKEAARLMQPLALVDAKQIKLVLKYVLQVYDNVLEGGQVPRDLQRPFLAGADPSSPVLPWPADLGDDLLYTNYGERSNETPQRKSPLLVWARLTELPCTRLVNPQLNMVVNDDCISQVSLGDCSVVASLICINQLRQRTGKDIILHRIYPQRNNIPYTSPNGLYVLKLPIGGIDRFVDVDDSVPVSSAYSLEPCHAKTELGSLWPALVEKAYLQTMGGYSFAGSHAAIDIFNLTGWIPDYLPLASYHQYAQTTTELFEKLYEPWISGKLLLSLGTGADPPCHLVASHDYAIIGMKRNQTEQLVQLANPWNSSKSNQRDTEWTPWSLLFVQFEMLYLNECRDNWKHQAQHITIFSLRDSFKFKHNLSSLPQVCIANEGSEQQVKITITTTKMGSSTFTALSTLKLYECSDRVISDADYIPLAASIESNSNCVTLSATIPARSTTIAAVSYVQNNEDTSWLSNILTVSSPYAVRLSKAANKDHITTIQGSWSVETPCGRYLSAEYDNNPHIALEVPQDCEHLTAYLFVQNRKSKPTPPSHLAMFWAGTDTKALLSPQPLRSACLGSSGSYMKAAVSLQLRDVRAGHYLLIPSLFDPMRSKYEIIVKSSVKCALRPTRRGV